MRGAATWVARRVRRVYPGRLFIPFMGRAPFTTINANKRTAFNLIAFNCVYLRLLRLFGTGAVYFVYGEGMRPGPPKYNNDAATTAAFIL